MPKKIPITEKREWLEAYEQGKSEASIAREKHRDLKVIKRGIQDARLERDGATARAELVKAALLKHQNQLLSVIDRILSAMVPPRPELEIRRGKNEALVPIPLPAAQVSYDPSKGLVIELFDENTPQWELLKEHLRRDRLWSTIDQWKGALIAHIKARTGLQLKLRILLESETGLKVTTEPYASEEASFVFSNTVKLFYGVALNKALGIPDETNPQDRIISTADGYVLHGQCGSQLAFCPGHQDECRDKILTAFTKIQNSSEVKDVVDTYADLKPVTTRARRPLEDVTLMGLVPGQCRICRRLSM